MRRSRAAPGVESSCRIRRCAGSAPARSPGPSTSASPPPVPPRGLRVRRDHVRQHRLQRALSSYLLISSLDSLGRRHFSDKAPLSKSLLLVPSALSLLLALLLPHCQRFFVYDLQAVKEDLQIWRLICGRIICLDLKDTFCSSLLIYNFRIFERRYGSRKFASFLLGSWVLSALVDLILVEAMWYFFGIATAGNLPSGFLAPVFALFVPFYCSIPRIQVAQILGPLSITNKTLIYILGLQISGICYNSKVFQLQQVLCIPRWMAKFFSWTLEPIFSSPEPTTEARIGMGATVDIQRQQRMELLDRQLMLSQFAQVRRQRQQGGMINWNRLFPPLRQRRNINYQDGRQSEQQASPPLEVSEEQGLSLESLLWGKHIVPCLPKRVLSCAACCWSSSRTQLAKWEPRTLTKSHWLLGSWRWDFLGVMLWKP
uniref:UBA domain containing 2 n=1 Tax=Canis lupus familiaris TaxID=9615 RepID=A0A8C0MKE3_CANLF